MVSVQQLFQTVVLGLSMKLMQETLFTLELIGHVRLPITVLIRALGFSSDEEIIDLIGDNEYLRNTLERDNTETSEKALLEIYERLRPGEPPTLDSAKKSFIFTFFRSEKI